jgi:hypothetical protein
MRNVNVFTCILNVILLKVTYRPDGPGVEIPIIICIFCH